MQPAWNADGLWLATTHPGGAIQVVDAHSAEVLSSIPTVSEAISLSWSPTGPLLAAGLANGTVKIWDPTRLHTPRRIPMGGCALSLAFSPDGGRLLVGIRFGRVKVLDVDSEQETLSFKKGFTWNSSVAWSPDGKRFAARCPEGVAIYDSQSGQPVLPPLERDPASIAWSPDGTQLAVGSEEIQLGKKMSHVTLFDAAKGRLIAESSVGTGLGSDLAWHPESTSIAMSGTPIRIWDSALREERKIEGSDASTITWSEDGARLAAAGADGDITLYDATTRKIVGIFRGHSHQVTTLAWHPHTTRLVSGCKNGSIKIWDTATLRELISLDSGADQITDVAWSPDGLRLASTSFDGGVRIWDGRRAEQHVKNHGDLRRQAQDLAQTKQYDKAIERLEQLRDLHPDERLLSTEIQRLKWRGALQSVPDNQLADVASTLKELRRQMTASPDDRLCLVRAQFELSPREALATLEEMLSDYPKNQIYQHELAFLYEGRARQLVESGDVERASAVLQKLVKRFPDRPDFRSEFAYQMAKMDRLDETVAMFEKISDVFPAWPDYRPELARNLTAGGEHALAVKLYEKLVAAFPEDPDYRAGLGDSLRANERYTEAISILRPLVEEFPEVPQYRAKLGNTLRNRGQDFFGASEFDEAIADYTEAEALLRQLVVEFPDASQYHELLTDILMYRAACYRDRGDFDEYIADYMAVGAFDSHKPDYCQPAAWRLLTLPDCDTRHAEVALELAQRAVVLSPEREKSRLTVAMAHYRLGDWQSVIDELTTRPELDPVARCYGWFYLSMAYWQLGREAEALRYYDWADKCMQRNLSDDEGFIRLRAEAAELLGK
jgi:WD40 repeat protein/predicted Zn-dependent protease